MISNIKISASIQIFTLLWILISSGSCRDISLSHTIPQWDIESERKLTYKYEIIKDYDSPGGPNKTEKVFIIQFEGNGLVSLSEENDFFGLYYIGVEGGLTAVSNNYPPLPAELGLLAVAAKQNAASNWTRHDPSQKETDMHQDKLIIQSKREFYLASKTVKVKGYFRIVPNNGGKNFLGAFMNSPPGFLFEWQLGMAGEAIFRNGNLEYAEHTIEFPPAGEDATIDQILNSPYRILTRIQLINEE